MSDDKMRSDFEEALSQGFWRGHVFSFVRNNDGTYLELATQLCWLTWQAALSQIEPALEHKPEVSEDQIEECGESYVSIPHIELFNLREENARLKSKPEVSQPVAEICSGFALHWVGAGAIAPIIEKHNLKVGDKLFSSPPDYEALRQRVAELANKGRSRDLNISDYSDVEYVQAYFEAHFEDFDELVADRSRLQSECDIAQINLNSFRIDALRYRFMRDVSDDDIGKNRVPCIAIPLVSGAYTSGNFANGVDADYVIDCAMKEQAK